MAKRVYKNDRIEVSWNSERCIHTARCLMAAPEVFDTRRRPWVDINAAPADLIAQACDQCPTGALTYRRLDADQPAEATETEITVWPGGPLIVQGLVRVQLPDGRVLAEERRLALCRCGGSQNQPFCDNTHRRIGFRGNPRVILEHRDQAEAPTDISEQRGLPD
jgi:uncharacterized Fe-S cluster protein YjdI/CDGSH-type Zn-finger protein